MCYNTLLIAALSLRRLESIRVGELRRAVTWMIISLCSQILDWEVDVDHILTDSFHAAAGISSSINDQQPGLCSPAVPCEQSLSIGIGCISQQRHTPVSFHER